MCFNNTEFRVWICRSGAGKEGPSLKYGNGRGSDGFCISSREGVFSGYQEDRLRHVPSKGAGRPPRGSHITWHAAVGVCCWLFLELKRCEERARRQGCWLCDLRGAGDVCHRREKRAIGSGGAGIQSLGSQSDWGSSRASSCQVHPWGTTLDFF
ncbi:hypothetical protein VTI74DRAFT_4040 [Chaetomium olivicolor]